MSAYSKLPETELLERLKSGDDRALAEIYHRYWEKLLAIGYFHTHDKQMAEDIVHEVMMSLWTRKADRDIKALQSYLATAIKCAVFKAVAREKRRKEIRAGQ